jgi:hypothetical protein
MATLMMEKRRDERVEECVVLSVSSREKSGRLGVTRDRSRTGLSFVTPSIFQIGDELTLARPGADRDVGTVVRIDRTGEAPMRFAVAVSLSS